MSETKYAYQKLLKEHNLQISDLPEDAKVCIKAITNIDKAVVSNEKKGVSPSAETLAKIKANDKWACNEILDFVEGTNDNDDEIPYEEDEIIDDLEDDDVESVEAENVADEKDPRGLQIDADLKTAFESGKTTITLEELKTISKIAYNVIFNSYDDSGDNGVITSHYSLVETDEEVFTLTKK